MLIVTLVRRTLVDIDGMADHIGLVVATIFWTFTHHARKNEASAFQAAVPAILAPRRNRITFFRHAALDRQNGLVALIKIFMESARRTGVFLAISTKPNTLALGASLPAAKDIGHVNNSL